MRRIKTKVDPKDRIICVAGKALDFYYQPYRTNQRYYMFCTEDFSGSVFTYFRKHGRNLRDLGFSLTLNELYRGFKSYDNPKLCKVMERIPGQVEYVVREYLERSHDAYENCDYDRDCIA